MRKDIKIEDIETLKLQVEKLKLTIELELVKRSKKYRDYISSPIISGSDYLNLKSKYIKK